MAHLYEQVAREFLVQLDRGGYRAGDRLPGVRSFSRERGVSIATVLAAYRILEDDGHIEVRPRSGFYVRARSAIAPISVAPILPVAKPVPVTGQEMALALTQAANNPSVVQLGAAVPDASFLPSRHIQQAMLNAVRRFEARVNGYEMTPGAPELRRQIARRMTSTGTLVAPDELVITSGCQEAVRLALRAVAEPGDVIAIESPAFYGALQVIESLGLKAIEIPADPTNGIAIDALAQALAKWPVKACLVVPNNNNPLGYTVTDQVKCALVDVLMQYGVTLIENDIYGDLSFDGRRPSTCKGLRPDADVIYCSSFSKTLSPGLRVGWIVGGHHQRRIDYLKYVSNIAATSIAQLAVADYLESGRYERYLRTARGQYQRGVMRMSDAVARYFPAETRISQPQGGFVIWLELDADIDCFALAKQVLAQGVSIAPGPIFSAVNKFQNCMRLSCATPWGERLERALALLAKAINKHQRRQK